MSMPTPAAIAALLKNLGDDLAGATTTAEHLTGRRWLVSAANERVEVRSEYQVVDTRRLQLKASELLIDGRQVPRMQTYTDLVRLFANPDGGGEPAGDDPELVEVPVEDTPEGVRPTYQMLAKRRPSGLQLLVRRAGRRWYVCLENDRVQLRFVFVDFLMDHRRPTRDTGVGPPRHRPIVLVVDGEDRTDEVDGRLERALAMAGSHQAAQSPAGIAGEHAAAVNTGVDVRRQTVIRT